MAFHETRIHRWTGLGGARAARRRHLASLASALELVVASSGTASADPSSGIVVDGAGQVYFADERRNVVWRVDEAGALEPFVSDVHSHALALGPNGEIVGEHVRYLPVEARWISSLWTADRTGHLTVIYGPAAGFPPGLVMDREGNRYEKVQGESPTPTSRIVRRGVNGRTQTIAGRARGDSDGQGTGARLGRIVALAWGPKETIYFTDGSSVRKLTLDGWVSTMARVPKGVPDKELPSDTPLWGLTVSEDGTVLVANYAQRRVLEIGASGPPREIVRSEPPWAPTGVALRHGKVYVLEHGFRPPKESLGPRVREVLPDGTARVLATVTD